ncbi:MAG: hypothetical protein AAGA71_01570 [Pseudomonadota bacterium]
MTFLDPDIALSHVARNYLGVQLDRNDAERMQRPGVWAMHRLLASRLDAIVQTWAEVRDLKWVNALDELNAHVSKGAH